MKKIAIYLRVSTNGQKFASQIPDLKRWIAAQDPAETGEVQWYRDKSTGRNTERPGYKRLMNAIDRLEISQVIIWRLDRISRSVADLQAILTKFKAKKVNLVSLKENLDMKSASGRLLINILGSLAEFESELRSERVLAGQAAARAAGKTWGGRPKGSRHRVTPDMIKSVLQMYRTGWTVTAIAKEVHLSRETIYTVLKESGYKF